LYLWHVYARSRRLYLASSLRTTKGGIGIWAGSLEVYLRGGGEGSCRPNFTGMDIQRAPTLMTRAKFDGESLPVPPVLASLQVF